MSFDELRQIVREDWCVHGKDWTRPGFRALAVQRFGVWLGNVRGRIPRFFLVKLYWMLYRYVRNHYGIELDHRTKVGRRVLIAHQGGIVIHPRAEIGDDCLIRQGVTIGASSHGRALQAPKLGKGVQVGCGAAILGSITVGDGAHIGANVVVMMNVPPGSLVVAPPCRVVRMQPAESEAPASADAMSPATVSE